jgi:hypothetical protein
LPAQAHADGALIQLAAGFDAFACAVAHHYGLENPDRASLWETTWVARLVEAAEHDLRAILHAVEREADPPTAKAVLWHYGPETIPLSMGKVMAPRVVR